MKPKKWVALATAAAMCLSMTACSVSVSTNETTKAAEPPPQQRQGTRKSPAKQLSLQQREI